ncbi:uncharacterized protein BJX67DRAFT_182698 [Aspergillus lucknowensis]|uniref:Uncharacterized protein n=1 Tax=Aspergillus lucknowensis TaxID=176173 RepID=A0ABR4LLD9_9EURO
MAPRLRHDFMAYTPERTFSGGSFTSASELGVHAFETILGATHHQEVVYTSVPPNWSASILQYLDKSTESAGIRKNYNSDTQILWIRIMPTEIHNCIQVWIRNEMARWMSVGLLTLSELCYLNTLVGTTIDFRFAPYAGSRKEPDLLVRQNNNLLPVLAIETGWTESYSRLLDDMNLWLVGGNGAVKAVIIVKWGRVGSTNQVKGTAELYTLDPAGMPIRRQSEQVFPEPPPPQARAQEFSFTRRLLVGTAVFQGRNADDVFTLKIDELRRNARDALSLMGLVPS